MASTTITGPRMQCNRGLRKKSDGLGSVKESTDFLPPGSHLHSPSNNLSRWPQPRTQRRKTQRSRQQQTSIMKISTHQLHVSVSRQITLKPLGSTVLGFCPKCKALFHYCVLIDPLWALDDSKFSAHTSASVSSSY